MEEGGIVDGKMNWIWRKRVSVGKKILAIGFVLSCAPFVVLPLVVASTIALVLSLPYCVLLVSYVSTEKLMRTLLPGTACGNKSTGHGDIYDEDIAQVTMRHEPILVKNEEEGTSAIASREEDRIALRVLNIFVDVSQSAGVEDMKKESKSLLESIREDNGLIVYSDAKSEKVGAGVEDESGKNKVSRTKHKGELEVYRGKDMEKSSNEMKVLYNEEQMWGKMEAIRKIVGYNVARSTTYLEELKALHMFMGVEFPMSMLEKENQDSGQVSERLFFLMSVIGIE